MRSSSGLVCAALALSACGRLGFDNLDPGDVTDPDAMGSEMPLPEGRWATVSMSGYAACGVTTGGELWCWGANWSNRLGIGEGATAFLPPARVDSRTDWVSVVVDTEHQCAIDTAQRLWCWGNNRHGAVGSGPIDLVAPAPIRIDIGAVRSVATGNFTTCAVTVGGELWCWGRNAENQVAPGPPTDAEPPTRRDEGTTWTAVTVGSYHACGLQASSIYCWGDHEFGQVGAGPGPLRVERPQLVPLERGWTQVTAGAKHTCALAANGESFCWGVGWEHRLGTGNSETQFAPMRTLVPPLTTLDAAWDHTCGLTATNELWCWGYAGRGRVPGIERRSQDPIVIDLDIVPAQIAVGGSGTCLIDAAHRLWCSGPNGTGQLGSSTGETLELRQADPRTDWIEIDGGQAHMCGRTEVGDLYCWGRGTEGQLGDGAVVDRQLPVALGSFDAVQAGALTTVARRGGELWVWGYDAQNDGYPSVPTFSTPDVAGMAQGADHRCWLLPGGELHCAGYNTYGQIGDGTTNRATDAIIPGTWRSVWAGAYATCGVRDGGGTSAQLYCWGKGLAAGVGPTDQSVPVLAALPDAAVREVAFGQDFGCAIVGSGELWCWGVGSWGRLGNGSESDQPSPVRVGTRSDWKTVDAGDWHACAVASDNTLWCWGHADQGQGGPLANASLEPVQLGGSDWNDVACAHHNTCALERDGTRWCGGANDSGELGNGTSWSSSLVVVP